MAFGATTKIFGRRIAIILWRERKTKIDYVCERVFGTPVHANPMEIVEIVEHSACNIAWQSPAAKKLFSFNKSKYYVRCRISCIPEKRIKIDEREKKSVPRLGWIFGLFSPYLYVGGAMVTYACMWRRLKAAPKQTKIMKNKIRRTQHCAKWHFSLIWMMNVDLTELTVVESIFAIRVHFSKFTDRITYFIHVPVYDSLHCAQYSVQLPITFIFDVKYTVSPQLNKFVKYTQAWSTHIGDRVTS